jgi:hypothetical protein
MAAVISLMSDQPAVISPLEQKRRASTIAHWNGIDRSGLIIQGRT